MAATPNTFTWNGTDTDTYGLVVMSEVEFPVASGPQINTLRLPGTANRVYFVPGASSEGAVAFDCVVSGTSLSHIAGRLDSIRTLLTGTADGTLEYPKLYTDRGWLARWDNQMMIRPLSTTAVQTRISFVVQPAMVAT